MGHPEKLYDIEDTKTETLCDKMNHIRGNISITITQCWENEFHLRDNFFTDITNWFCTKGSQRDVVYLGCLIAPSYMSPNARVVGVEGSQPMSTAVHMEPK